MKIFNFLKRGSKFEPTVLPKRLIIVDNRSIREELKHTGCKVSECRLETYVAGLALESGAAIMAMVVDDELILSD
jgi:hypothetical protein